MSIKADAEELERYQLEIKNLQQKLKFYREKEKEIKERIDNYLMAKDLPGIKHHGTAIIVENKEARTRKKVKDQTVDAIAVLEKHGITNPNEVLQELIEARKGDLVPARKLKIQKYKD